MNLLISVDTGAAHLAAVSNIPVIIMYGTSIPEHSMPVSSRAETICVYKECSPCDHRFLTLREVCRDNKCLKEITPDMVFDKVRKILK